MNSSFIKYANSFQAVARLELESITALLDILDNPHKKVKCIHVAGTNGKGSVCAFLQSIITESGKKAGRYISPEMFDIRERITINSQMIPHSDLESIMSQVKNAADQVNKIQGDMPTQFEIWTAAAFLYFYNQDCDIAVIETGLGGERDATNVIESPLFSIITRIDMDHMSYLGNSLAEVASAKAGIIKKGCPVITIKQDDEAQSVIEKVCREKGCCLMCIGDAEDNSFSDCRETFSYRGIDNITLGLPGINQTENARLAIDAALAMGIDKADIKAGLKKAINKGRFELIGNNVIFDGAHNPNGMQSLINNLNRYYPDDKINFICGFMGDKDLSGMLPIMKQVKNASFCAVTVQDNPRAMTGNELKKQGKIHGIDFDISPTVNDAIKKTAKDGLTVICGSLYLYKDIDFKLF